VEQIFEDLLKSDDEEDLIIHKSSWTMSKTKSMPNVLRRDEQLGSRLPVCKLQDNSPE
jgi:hypothetical protein